MGPAACDRAASPEHMTVAATFGFLQRRVHRSEGHATEDWDPMTHLQSGGTCGGHMQLRVAKAERAGTSSRLPLGDTRFRPILNPVSVPNWPIGEAFWDCLRAKTRHQRLETG